MASETEHGRPLFIVVVAVSTAGESSIACAVAVIAGRFVVTTYDDLDRLTSDTAYLPDPLPGKALPGGGYDEELRYVPRSSAVFGDNDPITGDFFADFFKQGGAVGRLANIVPIFNAGAAFHDSLFVRGFLDKTLLTNIPLMVPAGIITLGAVLDGPLTVQLSLAGKRGWR